MAPPAEKGSGKPIPVREGTKAMAGTQAEILREKYRVLQEAGALDIKFCFAPLAEETDESVCASINQALDAITRGEYEELPVLGDSRRQG
jgi:hypothetical protein